MRALPVQADPDGGGATEDFTARIIRVESRTKCWWQGRELYCGRCGCSFVLEPPDHVTQIGDADYCFQAPCPNCRQAVPFSKPDWL